MPPLFTLLIGIAIGFFLARGFKAPQIQKILVEKPSQQEKRKQDIIQPRLAGRRANPRSSRTGGG